jgi:hypothetical protein
MSFLTVWGRADRGNVARQSRLRISQPETAAIRNFNRMILSMDDGIAWFNLIVGNQPRWRTFSSSWRRIRAESSAARPRYALVIYNPNDCAEDTCRQIIRS